MAQEIPKYNEILNHIFDQNCPKIEEDNSTDDLYGTINKSPNAIWLTLSQVDNSKNKDSLLIWTLDNQYTPNNYPKICQSMLKILLSNNHHGAYYFNLLPYYGDYDWATKVIDYYDEKNNLTTVDHHILAKAYSQKSINELDIWSNINRKMDVDKYRQDCDSSIGHYKKLVELNPNYKTYTGDSKTSYWSEIVSTYYFLKISGKAGFEF